MLESKVESWLCNEIRKRGGLTYKWVSPGNVGVPDRIIFVNGKTWLVELKQTRGSLSAIQRFQIAKLQSNGMKVRVVYGIEGARRLIGEIFEQYVEAPKSTDSLGIEEWR